MRHVDAYLTIPDEVARFLGGLAWSLDGEALKRADGSTFALTEEILVFLEGFALQRPLLPFGYLLLAYGLLRGRLGPGSGSSPTVDRLRTAFLSAGRSERNAGAFFAVVLQDLPSALEPPTIWEIWRRVVLNVSDPIRLTTQELTSPALAHRPEAFLSQVHQKLAAFSDEELEIWLHTGTGPVSEAAQQLVDSLRERGSCSLEGLLGKLANRRRLAGALPLVEQLGAALTLPPRRLVNPELPLGGYSDLANRGHPDQILLSQFALEELELLRRLAERELLYYRREEPRAEVREELVVVLDQGVRTWGGPRLVLLAATYVLARLAEARRQPFRLVTTDRPGPPWDPADLPAEELARRLEVADLSPHPGATLEGALEQPATQPRDVVLLTHPLALDEPDVQAAALRVAPGTRLFSLTADREGRAALGEFQHGHCIPLRTFRVDLTSSQPAPAMKTRPGRPLWSGSIEPNPCRFFIHPGSGQPTRFTFDPGEDHLLLSLAGGSLMLVPLHGPAEMLPRAATGTEILTQIDWLQGAPGCFLIGGRTSQGQILLARYHLQRRHADTWSMGTDDGPLLWIYAARHECVVVHGVYRSVSVDLANNEQRQQDWHTPARYSDGSRASAALDSMDPGPSDTPWVRIVPDRQARPGAGPWLYLDPSTGELILTDCTGETVAFCPQQDGEPALRGAQVLHAQRGPHCLVLQVDQGRRDWRSSYHRLMVYRIPSGQLLHRIVPLQVHVKVPTWTLSPQGAFLAHLKNDSQVEVRGIQPKDNRQLITPRSRFEAHAQLLLGPGWLALLGGGHGHVFHWGSEELVLSSGPGIETLDSLLRLIQQVLPAPVRDRPAGQVLSQSPAFLAPEAGRYRTVHRSRLIAAMDAYGVVTLYNTEGMVLAQAAHRGGKAAMTTPAGDRFGHPSVLGQPATAESARVIAALLRAAEQEAPEYVP